MSLLTNLDLLRRVPLFAALTPALTAQLADAVTKRSVKRGDLIVEQGQKSNALFVILSGRASVVMTDQRSREVILATLGVSDYIGEISLIDGQSHSASVRAETPTDLLVLGQAEFHDCLASNHAMALAIIDGLARRLRVANDKISTLALMDVYDRVAHELRAMSRPDSDGRRVIQGKTSRQGIARKVGASREMVSRVMRDFEHNGQITTRSDGSIVLASPFVA